MEYTEIIERDAYKNYHISYSESSIPDIEAMVGMYVDGITSPLAKQITEIEVVKGNISSLKSVFKEVAKNCNHSIFTDEIFENEIYQLEHLRDKLINELKLK